MIQPGRISGVLLPLFSLRSRHDFGVGDFGAAKPFMEWLAEAKQKLWMVLPLLPTAPGDSSPYATRCAFGLNPLFIHLRDVPEFAEAGGEASLTAAEKADLALARNAQRVRYDKVFPLKWAVLRRAFERFEAQGKGAPRAVAFDAFRREQAAWLDAYVLYAALSEEHLQRPWWEWPQGLKERKPDALQAARERLEEKVRFHAWLQWVAHTQWEGVRTAAKACGVYLCGDEPFIVGQDSADSWAHPNQLRRDARLGVPPDDFSATGQDWGLPYFDFQEMEKDNFAWVRARAERSAVYYDVRRADHAVGYFRQYIRDERTPKGRFLPTEERVQQALGERMFGLLGKSAGIIAEDLGVIPPFVRETLDRLGVPGYRVMRWERGPQGYRNPHQYPRSSLVTTGTHDTDTLRQWWEGASDAERAGVAQVYPELHGLRPVPRAFTPQIHEALLAAAENAQSELCVLPWQDVLGTSDRINLPGSVGDANWSYRMERPVEDISNEGTTRAAAERLGRLTLAAGR
jgi:4-alpha-glucanotransferase